LHARYNLINCTDLPKCLHELSFGIHEVNVYWVVDKVIPVRIGVWGSGKVDPICFANGFDAIVVTDETDEPGMKICEITCNLGYWVASWVDRDEDRLKHCTVLFFYGNEEIRQEGPTRRNKPRVFIVTLILSSSAVHISGQFVNPK
jgi:hypothetical protein